MVVVVAWIVVVVCCVVVVCWTVVVVSPTLVDDGVVGAVVDAVVGEVVGAVEAGVVGAAVGAGDVAVPGAAVVDGAAVSVVTVVLETVDATVSSGAPKRSKAVEDGVATSEVTGAAAPSSSSASESGSGAVVGTSAATSLDWLDRFVATAIDAVNPR